MKSSIVCLVILANFCLSTLALPARMEDEDPDFHKREAESKRGISYGTALGHKSGSNNDYVNEREKAYKDIFGKREMTDYSTLEDLENMYKALSPSEKRAAELHKRGPFTFGTALGHKQRGSKASYVNSVNAKFNELFGDDSD